ncbi:MAG: glycoside hydrolase family 3 C-terminal domain-containing protein [Propionicimonas sp.]|uniref:beta-glucosidase n=1 Tax=Propionicimonas sp. TaxID=1955623 RepID=UPI003D0EBF7C
MASAVALIGPTIVALAPAAPAAAAVDCSTVAWMDTSKTAAQRAAALLDASTQYQKYRWLVEQPANSPQETTFSGVTYPVQVDCTPTVVYTDGPDGVRSPTGVTAFPAQIALASAWSSSLAQTKGTAQADEAFDMRRNGVLGPGVSSSRTPLAGRTPEYLGEDAVLAGNLAGAMIKGIQNPTGDRAVMAEVKHYVANEQETDRQTSSSNVSERALREIYELPFEIAVDSQPANVMCSYNQINGTYACENDRLKDVVKGSMGLDGYVVSDFGAVHSTAKALMSGLDQELNRPRYFTPALLDAALADGSITQARIDEAATRVVTAYIKAGLFDHPMADTAVADASTDTHKALARTISEQGSVLLKNDRGTLPLSAKRALKVALIGPTASSTVTNGISAKSVCAMANPFGGGITLSCEDLVSPETSIRSVVEANGGTLTWNPGADLDSVKADAAAADVAIVFGYQRMGEFNDIADLSLQGSGDTLVEAVAGAAKKTVVVLQTGSAVEMPWLKDVDSVLETWYGGEQMGPALANILFGKVNPSGKLPMTFPASLADTPTNTSEQYPGIFSDGSTTRPAGTSEIRQVNYTEGLKVGYRWYASQGIEPLFPFGYGLSYTSFRYSKLQVTPLYSGKGKRDLQLRFAVTNTGRTAGTETAQAYVQLPAKAGEPAKRLLTWQKVSLKPGQTTTVQIRISAKDLAEQHLLQYWDTKAEDWRTATGVYKVTVGGSYDTTLTDYSLVWNN